MFTFKTFYICFDFPGISVLLEIVTVMSHVSRFPWFYCPRRASYSTHATHITHNAYAIQATHATHATSTSHPTHVTNTTKNTHDTHATVASFNPMMASHSTLAQMPFKPRPGCLVPATNVSSSASFSHCCFHRLSVNCFHRAFVIVNAWLVRGR